MDDLTSVPTVDRLESGELDAGEPDGVELSTTTGGDAGIYLRTPLGALRIPMDETTRVSTSNVDVGPDGDGAELYARHDVFLFGRPFLELDYRMTRLSSP